MPVRTSWSSVATISSTGVAEDLLGGAGGVDVGRVEHGETVFEANVDESRGLGDVGVAPGLEHVDAAERAGAESEDGDVEAAAAEWAVVHAALLLPKVLLSCRVDMVAAAAVALAVALVAGEAVRSSPGNFADSQALYDGASCRWPTSTPTATRTATISTGSAHGLGGQTNNSNGDADRNGTVNGIDLPPWQNKYGTSGGLPPSGVLEAVSRSGGDRRRRCHGVRGTRHWGDPRFVAKGQRHLSIDPEYEVSVLPTNVFNPRGGGVSKRDPLYGQESAEPADGEGDALWVPGGRHAPGSGLEGVQTGFTWQGGGFVQLFDPDAGGHVSRRVAAARHPDADAAGAVVGERPDPGDRRRSADVAQQLPGGEGRDQRGGLEPDDEYVNLGSEIRASSTLRRTRSTATSAGRTRGSS